MAFDLGAALRNVSNSDTGRKQITYLPINSLDSDAGNFYELRDVDALADNISLAGLQQPILVRGGHEIGRYTIVSGHRRLAACKKLAEDNPDSWKEIPCIIEHDHASPALQQLRLIYANANTRQLTSAELSEQAQQVEKLLYELKEEGYEFPGRMRDHVAEAVGASRTKLARLKVIRDSLIPEWTARWKDNKLPESVAYELAKATPEHQRCIFDSEVKGYGDDFPTPVLPTLENRLSEMEKAQSQVSKLHCSILPGSNCLHLGLRLQKAARLGTYSALPCTGCCRECQNLPYCSSSCEMAGDLKKEKRSKISAESAAARSAQKAEEKARKESDKRLLAKAWARVGAIRVNKDVSPADFVKETLGYSYPDITNRLPEMETGNVRGTDRMPGGIWADEARHLIAAADMLGCSVDYLLGRDVPEKPVPDSIWNSGSPRKQTDYIVLYSTGDHEIKTGIMHWSGSSWQKYGVPIPDHWQVKCWTENPIA